MAQLDLDVTPAVLLIDDDGLRGALAAALTEAGFEIRGEGEAADLLVIEAGDGDPWAATLRPEAISAAQKFAAGAQTLADRSIVFVAGQGPAPEALQGAVRALARSCAPGVRVNAIAPEQLGGHLYQAQAGKQAGAQIAGQVAALVVYLARARTVTGQTLVTGLAAPG